MTSHHEQATTTHQTLAFADFYQAYQPEVQNRLTLRGVPEASCEDSTQDIFCSLLTLWQSVCEPTQPYANATYALNNLVQGYRPTAQIEEPYSPQALRALAEKPQYCQPTASPQEILHGDSAEAIVQLWQIEGKVYLSPRAYQQLQADLAPGSRYGRTSGERMASARMRGRILAAIIAGEMSLPDYATDSDNDEQLAWSIAIKLPLTTRPDYVRPCPDRRLI